MIPVRASTEQSLVAWTLPPSRLAVGLLPTAIAWLDEYKRILKLFEERVRTAP